METQKLDNPMPKETAFEEDDIVDAIEEDGADEVDQNFIDELDNSMSEEIRQDQLKA